MTSQSSFKPPGVPIPAPTPSINAWDKPINITSSAPSAIEPAVTANTVIPTNTAPQTDQGEREHINVYVVIHSLTIGAVNLRNQ